MRGKQRGGKTHSDESDEVETGFVGKQRGGVVEVVDGLGAETDVGQGFVEMTGEPEDEESCEVGRQHQLRSDTSPLLFTPNYHLHSQYLDRFSNIA